ncbi:MAG: hypothetical protein LBT79_07090 [Elusimicrobiota bacterium]|jgi:hypothetical protein|nr:hypothetical protein [Elusimicrobiota bacterium]
MNIDVKIEVGIKDMQFPNSCSECDFSIYDIWGGSCGLLHINICDGDDKKQVNQYESERYRQCPLVKINL